MRDNELDQNPDIKTIKSKAGKQLLTDDEILILTLSEIAHTFTYEEKNYSARK